MPDRLTLQPRRIEKTNPSVAKDLLECELRVAFARDGAASAWRRPSTYSALGNAAHALIEAAYRGREWPVDDEQRAGALRSRWDSEIAKQCDLLAHAWEPAEVPLPADWPNYQLTRLHALRRADSLARSARREPRQGGRGIAGVEVSLSDPATGLEGRADRIEVVNGKIRVVDLKTGANQAEPTPAQQRQLLIYAVLVHRQHGEWPAEVVIETTRGTQYAMPVDPVAAEAAAAEALDAVARFNAKAESRDAEYAAAPSADTCRWCPYRVACSRYWSAALEDWQHHALMGSIEGLGGQDASRYVEVRLESPADLKDRIVHISGLSALPESTDRWCSVSDVAGFPAAGAVHGRWSSLVRFW